jgi:hypothetical protein
MWPRGWSARRLLRRRPRRWGRRHQERQGVRELWKRPPLLLLADEDRDGELLLGELERELEGLATVGGLEVVVDDMVHHVVTDHPAIVDLAEDLAADTRRRRRRWRLDRHVVVLIVVVMVCS